MTVTRQAPQRAQTQTVEQDDSVLLDRVLEQTAAKVDSLSSRYAKAILEAPGDVQRALLMAQGLNRLRESITPEMLAEVMRLMNTPNGFLTDRGMARSKEKTAYDAETVRECLVEALLAGLHICGNEWNILAGRMYVTLNGWQRKFQEIPGITDISEVPGVPRAMDGQVICRVAISWKLHGTPNLLTDHEGKPGRPFPIITTQYSSPDQNIGKARRKAYKAAYEKATGSICTAEDGAVGEEIPSNGGQTRTQEALAKLPAAPTEADTEAAAERAAIQGEGQG